jgi:hypothetical protein
MHVAAAGTMMTTHQRTSLVSHYLPLIMPHRDLQLSCVISAHPEGQGLRRASTRRADIILQEQSRYTAAGHAVAQVLGQHPGFLAARHHARLGNGSDNRHMCGYPHWLLCFPRQCGLCCVELRSSPSWDLTLA